MDVVLRRVTAGDAEMVFAWRSEAGARRYQPLRELPLEELRRALGERGAERVWPGATGTLQWIVVADGEPAGWINLDILSREHATGAVGYTVASAFQGRGIGTAALRALLAVAFGRDKLNLARVEGVAAVDNVGSRRVMERAGFRQEGVLRGLLEIDGVRVDHAVYGLLRGDWEALSAEERGGTTE